MPQRDTGTLPHSQGNLARAQAAQSIHPEESLADDAPVSCEATVPPPLPDTPQNNRNPWSVAPGAMPKPTEEELNTTAANRARVLAERAKLKIATPKESRVTVTRADGSSDADERQTADDGSSDEDSLDPSPKGKRKKRDREGNPRNGRPPGSTR